MAARVASLAWMLAMSQREDPRLSLPARVHHAVESGRELQDRGSSLPSRSPK